MNQFFQFLQNNAALVFIVGSIVIPAIGKALKAAQQKQKLREAAARARREEYERLRTGQAVEPVLRAPQMPKSQPISAPVPPSSPAQQRAAEIAAKRTAELDALRRKAQQRGKRPIDRTPAQPQPQSQTASQRAGGTKVVRLPGGIILEIPDESQPPAPVRRSPSESSPTQAQAQRQQQKKAARAQQNAQRPAQQAPQQRPSELGQQSHAALYDAQRAPMSMEDAYATPAGVIPRGSFAASANTRSMMFRKRMTRDDVRHAVVMKELLGRPLSERW